VGTAREIRDQAIAAFVTIRESVNVGGALVQEVKDHVANKIGAIARPESILFTADFPKTKSGKIVRRLLRDVAEVIFEAIASASSRTNLDRSTIFAPCTEPLLINWKWSKETSGTRRIIIAFPASN